MNTMVCWLPSLNLLHSMFLAMSKGLFPSPLIIVFQFLFLYRGNTFLKANLEQDRTQWWRAVFPSSSEVPTEISFPRFVKVWSVLAFFPHLIATDKADIPGINPSPARWCLPKLGSKRELISTFASFMRYCITWGLMDGNEQAFKSAL